MKNLTLTGLIIIGSFTSAYAQDNCTEQLRQAERRYDEGLLELIPDMIRPCMASGFTREEKVNAYRLLIQTHLFSDNSEAADEVMYRFLRDFPEYSITPTDPKEFVNLYQTYLTEPIFRIEPYLSISYSLPYVFEYFGVSDLNQNIPEYSSNLGFSAGANYTDRISANIDGSIGISLHYSRVDYFHQVFDYTYLDGTYTDILAGLPMSARYNFSVRGIDLFAKGGVEAQYLLQSGNSLIRGFTSGGDNIVEAVDLTEYRRRLDIRPFAGIGFTPELGNIRLMFDTGVRFGTIVPVNKDLRYSNVDLFEKFYMIEDKWIFNHFYFNFTYIFSIYKPRKIN